MRSSSRRVWIAQCLCPQRHCILAAADEAADAAAANNIIDHLKQNLADLLSKGVLNPWCGLCDAPRSRWSFEIGRTPFKTMREAMPTLAQTEAEQIATMALFGDLHLQQRPN